ncbi:MAG: sulfatase-like hydrolase/transferase [Pirellulaceae bacterium]
MSLVNQLFTPWTLLMFSCLILGIDGAEKCLRAMLFFPILIGLTAIQVNRVGAAPPNVILLITDDQGYGDVGFHGNRMIRTPTMDALARQSLRLTNFHVEPTCAETRAALMSGQFPLRVGVWHTIMGRSIMRADAVTMPQLFQAAGYRTGMFGKWHLGDNYPYRPQDRGFQKTLHHGGGGVGQTPDVWGNDYFDDVYWSGEELQPVRGYCTDVFFKAAEEFITAESDQPFFCYLATNAPHGPYEVEQAYRQPYLDQGVPEPMASFYGMITNIDDNLKRLLSLLDERDLARDTIVVFMTDNGTAAGFQDKRPSGNERWSGYNAGMRGTKGTQFDGGHRVPCFIRLPSGKHADREFSGLTAHVDLLPTLAGLCAVDTATAEHLDGRDLMPILDEREQPQPRTLVVQSHRVESPRKWIKSAVLTDEYRLVDGEKLYAINADVGQSTDIASEHPQLVQELRQAYESWWADCNPQPAEYSRIVLGAPATDIVRLTAHDWHTEMPPWNQGMIRKSPVVNGYWEVTVQRPGVYQFWLARQPLAEPRPLECEQVVLQVGEHNASVEVDPAAVLAPVTLKLPAGNFRLSSQLRSATDSSATAATDTLGAFYVYVSYQAPSNVDPTNVVALPDWLSPGDRIAWLGGTLIERAQESGQFEAQWLARAPAAGLTLCNLGWSGDDVRSRARNVFGDIQEGKSRRLRDLDLAAPSLVVAAYGMSEALSDAISAAEFESELSVLVAAQIAAKRRVVLCRVPAIELDDQAPVGMDWPVLIERYNVRRQQLDDAITKVAQSASQPVGVIDLPALKTSWFESGQYVSPQGYTQWSSSLAESVFGGNSHLTQSQLDKVATLARLANHQFFEMHRPQNETYLTLFRKHEQGNNAVEPLQNRALLADTQLRILRACTTQ